MLFIISLEVAYIHINLVSSLKDGTKLCHLIILNIFLKVYRKDNVKYPL